MKKTKTEALAHRSAMRMFGFKEGMPCQICGKSLTIDEAFFGMGKICCNVPCEPKRVLGIRVMKYLKGKNEKES